MITRTRILTTLFLLILLGVFFFFLYKIYIPRIAAFGCFDDCYNYAGGYNIILGKHIYRDFFFNHLPSMAFISAFIQQLAKPVNLYEFLLRHRQFILMWGFGWNLLFLLRFRFRAVFPIILYEVTKFFLFGDRFLAESLIVYPFMYLTYLLFVTPANPLALFDIIVAYSAFIFIALSREPYVPTAILLYGYILFRYRKNIGLPFWIFFSVGSLFLCYSWLSIPDMLRSISENKIIVASDQASGNLSVIRSLFYPVLIIISSSPWTYLRIILAAVSGIFLIGAILLKKKWNIILFLLLVLGAANLRPPDIGKPFYSSFHLLPWYGILITSTLSFIFELKQRKQAYWRLLFTGYAFVILFSVFSPKAFFREHVDAHSEFITNYSEELQISNVIHALSNPTSTLFLDGWAELILPLTHLSSPYRYTWYTGYMHMIDRYRIPRETMFREHPPDFYYGTCPSESNPERLMPDFAKTLYTNIPSFEKPTCLWIKTSSMSGITKQQWKKAAEQLYDQPITPKSQTEAI